MGEESIMKMNSWNNRISIIYSLIKMMLYYFRIEAKFIKSRNLFNLKKS